MIKTILCAAAVALSLAAGSAEAQTWYGTGNNTGGGWQYNGNGTWNGTGYNAGGGWQSDSRGSYYGTGNNAGSGYTAPYNPSQYQYNYGRPCVAALERC